MRPLKTARRPPIYPKTPGHLPCSSLTHPLPLPSRRPSVSFGGFGLKVIVDYPSRDEERLIVERETGRVAHAVVPVVSSSTIIRARDVVRQVYVDDKITEYVLDLVAATRNPEGPDIGELRSLIAFGASPRASIYLIESARAHAFLQGRGYVTPEDIKQLAPDVLRHRIITTYEAEAEEVTTADIVQRILDHVEVP